MKITRKLTLSTAALLTIAALAGCSGNTDSTSGDSSVGTGQQLRGSGKLRR